MAKVLKYSIICGAACLTEAVRVMGADDANSLFNALKGAMDGSSDSSDHAKFLQSDEFNEFAAEVVNRAEIKVR